jgi:hypothetical protein
MKEANGLAAINNCELLNPKLGWGRRSEPDVSLPMGAG